MALRITEECTACGLCLMDCPTKSISEGDIFVINSETCNECADLPSGPRCQGLCPVACIVKIESDSSK